MHKDTAFLLELNLPPSLHQLVCICAADAQDLRDLLHIFRRILTNDCQSEHQAKLLSRFVDGRSKYNSICE